MCLAIPSRIVTIDSSRQGTVDVLGVTRSASFELVPDAEVGDYVLLHAGFAIEVVDEQYARESLELIEEMPDLVALDLAGHGAAPSDGEVR